MSFWDSIRNLADNPLYRLERRRQWRGARPSLVVLGVFCCGCGYLAPYILAPALAAMAVVHDRRAQIWEDILLTRLSGEEIVAAKAAAAIQVPTAIVAAQALLMGALMGLGAAFGPTSSARQILADLAVALPAVAAAALAITTALVTGCLVGIRSGIQYRDGLGAVLAACMGMVALEGLVTAAVASVIGRSVPPNPLLGAWPWHLAAGAGLSAGFIVAASAVALANLLLSAGLWASCVRAIRPGEL